MSDGTTTTVTYGAGVPGDDELHLLGDVAGGRRVVELGIAGNAVALAEAGAKAIALDPDPDRIADLRGDAARAGVSVECHHGELADLGFAPSGTIDVVVANHTLDDDPDLGRTLRQVHRVLKPGAPFVLAMAHPFAAVGTTRRPLRRRPAHGRRPADRARPGQLPHRGVPRARCRRRHTRPDDARGQGAQAGLVTSHEHRSGS